MEIEEGAAEADSAEASEEPAYLPAPRRVEDGVARRWLGACVEARSIGSRLLLGGTG